MGFRDYFRKYNPAKSKAASVEKDVDKPAPMAQPVATTIQNQSLTYPPIYQTYYTGEKTAGEMGAAKSYLLAYNYLRVRSWQAYTESEVVQIIINKYIKWVIGNGLKLQPEPNTDVLTMEGITLNDAEFIKTCESRFNLFASSKQSDYRHMLSLNRQSLEVYKNALISGDCLVINRMEDGEMVTQMIDSGAVTTPLFNDALTDAAKARGNRIIHGVEINDRGEHVAYFVQNDLNKYSRIPRYGEESGMLQAFLVYGSLYRIDNVRGMPLLTAVLETLKKIDRYKEATVGSAEERQKIAFTVEHDQNSTGENPLAAKMAQAAAMSMGTAPETRTTDAYESMATKVAITTGKQAFNMPIGSKLQQLVSDNELNFKDFYNTNVQYVCAAVGIPFEVALSMFNSNYSASRAAIKDWEYNMKTARTDFADQYYKPFYNSWLELQILQGKIQAPGYAKAMLKKSIYSLEAYRQCRFLGANVPHIDPVKEVTALRLALGDDVTPLMTYDDATEALGNADFKDTIRKVRTEQTLTEDMPVKKVEVIKADMSADESASDKNNKNIKDDE